MSGSIPIPRSSSPFASSSSEHGQSFARSPSGQRQHSAGSGSGSGHQHQHQPGPPQRKHSSSSAGGGSQGTSSPTAHSPMPSPGTSGAMGSRSNSSAGGAGKNEYFLSSAMSPSGSGTEYMRASGLAYETMPDDYAEGVESPALPPLPASPPPNQGRRGTLTVNHLPPTPLAAAARDFHSLDGHSTGPATSNTTATPQQSQGEDGTPSSISSYGSEQQSPDVPPPPAGESPALSLALSDSEREGLGLGRIDEQAARAAAQQRRESVNPTGGIRSVPGPHREGSHSSANNVNGSGEVPVQFDEGVLRALCELDCGFPLLLDRLKQSMSSCREVSAFLKKRAQIEDDYARSMIKLARTTADSYGLSEGKSGTFVGAWMAALRTHEVMGEQRIQYAAQLGEMSEDLVGLNKELEKTRKGSKEMGARLERSLMDQEVLVDKARVRFDSVAEELERLLVLKQGESLKDPSILPHFNAAANGASTSSMGGSSGSAGGAGQAGNKRTFGKAMSKFKAPKSQAQVAKQEEDVRSRMGQSSDAYRSQVMGAQAVKQEYFNLQLPRMLRSLKESVDEADLGLQYHLSRYVYLFESQLVNDGLSLSPVNTNDDNQPGMKIIVDGIDNREDFKTFMQQFAVAWQMSGQKGPRRDETNDLLTAKTTLSPRSMSSASTANLSSVMSSNNASGAVTNPTFGVDLAEQMMRDDVEVPRILEKCAQAIEAHGLDSMGIYRLSGTQSRVQRLKGKLDRDVEGTNLLSEENLQDINDTTNVLKLWLRELPEPLLTYDLYQGFIDAAKIDNDRLRHIRLHERVNELPDPNYATLKFLMGHLDQIRQHEKNNQMGVSNLAIVFGPTLLGAPPNYGGADAGTSTTLADMQWQCKCVETVLDHYAEIFVSDE